MQSTRVNHNVSLAYPKLCRATAFQKIAPVACWSEVLNVEQKYQPIDMNDI